MMSLWHEDGDADDCGMMLLTDVQRNGADEVLMEWIGQPHHLAGKNVPEKTTLAAA